MRNNHKIDVASLIYDRDDLAAHLETERQKGSRIVLANGCFDVLQVGHVRYLRGAKYLGDLLLVVINSVVQFSFLKGAVVLFI